MKKILFSAFLITLIAGIAFAEWQVTFEESYFDNGIDQAVVDALREGGDPDSIVERGLVLEGLNPQNLIMALYCAGVTGQEIRDASANHDVSEMIVNAGYKKSIVECTDAVADSQAYIPVTTGFSGASPNGGGGGTFASSSTF